MLAMVLDFSTANGVSDDKIVLPIIYLDTELLSRECTIHRRNDCLLTFGTTMSQRPNQRHFISHSN